MTIPSPEPERADPSAEPFLTQTPSQSAAEPQAPSAPTAGEAQTTQAQQAAPKDPTLSAEQQAKTTTVAEVLAADPSTGGSEYPYEQAPVRENAPESLHGGGAEAFAKPSVAPTTSVSEGRS